MLLAQTKVLIALLAISTTLLLGQPLKAYAFLPESQAQNGQSAAVELQKDTTSDLTLIDELLPKAKIASFKEKGAFLASMRASKSSQKSAVTYASAKPSKVQAAVAIHPSLQPQVVVIAEPTIVAEQDTSAYSLNAQAILGMINSHRTQIGIVALQIDDRVQQVANSRAPEVFDEVFVNGNMHAGFYNRNLPYWATENIVYNNTEEGAYTWWMNSGIHRAAIENGAHTHTGIACDGKSCSMIFTSFQPK